MKPYRDNEKFINNFAPMHYAENAIFLIRDVMVSSVSNYINDYLVANY